MYFRQENKSFNRPWIKYYNKSSDSDLDYYDGTMCGILFERANSFPDDILIEYMGRSMTFRSVYKQIIHCSSRLMAMGIKKGDRVTIALPNIPQAVIVFYSVIAIGALANMIHPLSAGPEIEYYINISKSSCLFVLDAFYSKLKSINCPTLEHVVYCGADDYLSLPKKLGFKLTAGRKIKKPECFDNIKDLLSWKQFFSGSKDADIPEDELAFKEKKATDPCVILYSGGTTGKQKGILLSHLNFNALALQTITCGASKGRGESMLAVLPMFHGFGLGVCIHTAIYLSSKIILVPRFNADSFAKLLIKYKPSYMAGVPTLYEALLRQDRLKNADFSNAKGIFSGGDSLPHDIKQRFDKLITEKGSKVLLREGFGLTECVTASCLTPPVEYRKGSVGIPYPDTLYKVVAIDTTDEIPYMQQGEICICGPTVMIGYLDNEEETKLVLKKHSDGRTWLHTGDLGYMDSDGFVYFKARIKRMIKCSGYSVYPSEVENVIDSHEAVSMSCVIGVKDTLKMERVKAFVVLKDGYTRSDELKKELHDYCIERMARFCVPKDIEFRDALPMTNVGKIAYNKLIENKEE